jgi:hypothetical protein
MTVAVVLPKLNQRTSNRGGGRRRKPAAVRLQYLSRSQRFQSSSIADDQSRAV